jgi:uncharacterized protein (DUF608 family)
MLIKTQNLTIHKIVLVVTMACLSWNTWADAAASNRLFPADLPTRQWTEFLATGFSQPVSGVIYSADKPPCCGMPLGGVATGCLDLDVRGAVGFNALFNISYIEKAFCGGKGNVFDTMLMRKLPSYPPLLGLSLGGKTWVLASREILRGGTMPTCVDPVFIDRTETITLPEVQGVRAAKAIHYWGHYPVADMEFELEEPPAAGISVGLRAWSPFLPGDIEASNTPCAFFRVVLRNQGPQPQSGRLALNFPGPELMNKDKAKESWLTWCNGTQVHGDPDANTPRRFSRSAVAGTGWEGVHVTDGRHSYILGIIQPQKTVFGGELGRKGAAWAALGDRLPDANDAEPGASAAVAFDLAPGATQTIDFVLTWYAPQWLGREEESYLTMYARRFADATAVANRMVPQRDKLLRRVLAWQQVLYADKTLPVWLRDTLINNLALIPETTYWAQDKPPLGDWCYQGGYFGMYESPRGSPQIECIPCDWYGNWPIVFFFPELARSSLVGFRHYMRDDGAVPFTIGQWGRPNFVTPTYDWQIVLNGPCYVMLVDRLWQRTSDDAMLREFWPSLKKNLVMTMNLRPTPEGVISMPANNQGMEWFEWGEWLGMCAHTGGLRLATVRIAERMAQTMGDKEFQQQCRQWFDNGSKAMEEKMWTGSYYLNFFDEALNKKSDAVMGYQFDGQWAARLHGVPDVFRTERIPVVLETIKRCNTPGVICGALSFATPDGKPLGADSKIVEYGSHFMFFPEIMMLGMTYMQNGQHEFGLEMIHKTMEQLVCVHGHPWDLPNSIYGDSGRRQFGTDYYQNLMFWTLPAVQAQQSLKEFSAPGSLVDRILKAAKMPPGL